MEKKNVKENVRNAVMGNWVQGLAGYMATVGRKGVEDLMKECTEFRAFNSGDSEVD